jgi:hypothetical protein
MSDIRKEIKYSSVGSSGNRRSLLMLQPDYFKIDDRTLADFLVFTQQYAAQIYTHQLQSGTSSDAPADHTWEQFFNADLSVFLAKLSSIDQLRLQPFYLTEEELGGAEIHRRQVQSKIDTIMEVVSIINDSYYHVLNTHELDATIRPLANYIEEIKSHGYLKEIILRSDSAGMRIDNTITASKYAEIIWGPVPATIDDAEKEIVLPLHTSIEALSGMINGMFEVLRKIVFYSKYFLEESLQTNQKHNPAIGLFISFLKLYGFAQDDLNNITAKHLDYFYNELLQQKLKPSEPDHVHVCFSLSDHVDTGFVERGTLLKAGVDEEGYDCLYAADDHMTVNKTKVVELCTIAVNKEPLVGIENAYEFISAINQSNVLSSPKGNFDFSLAPIDLFSSDTAKTNTIVHTNKISEIGLAVASPILLLQEGIRECELILNFDLKSMSTLLTFLERYTETQELTFDRAFYMLFYRAFNISLSSSSGWYHVTDFKLVPPTSVIDSFKISFTLPMGAPAIIPMSADFFEKTEIVLYDSEWPVLKMCLTNAKSMFMYSYLKDLIISECNIRVSVQGIKNLEVYNDMGKLDTSNPFYPFGSTPVLGSNVLIGNDEIYKKNIKEISIELGWYNLPRTKGGFKTYYQEYDPTLENDSFQVAVTALSDYEFHPDINGTAEQHSLFSTTVEEEGELPVIAPVTKIEGLNIGRLKIKPDFSSAALIPFNNKAKSGYIKMELVGPAMGFGQAIYPTLFSSKIIKSIKSAQVELPNAPYVPQLKSITLNYTATTKIDFHLSSFVKSEPLANEKIFSIHPFGVQPIFKNRVVTNDHFLPLYNHSGYVFLGLDRLLPNEPLTIHFVFEASIGNEFSMELPVIEWFYISDDQWIAFGKNDLIFDTTDRFTTTGIVKLLMPKAISNSNTILPSDKYWIVAAIKGGINLVGKLKGVYTQALRLSWVPHKEGALWNHHLPANTINSFLQTKTEIAAVIQPSPSFGGRHAEQLSSFHTRVSERLRHRGRCVTTWDYERMILEQFPYVHQVKCISPIEYPEDVKAGTVILVVRPASGMSSDFTPPRFNYSILQRIKEYVSQYTSPFVQIQVINPVYEEVKITASIKLRNSAQKGTVIENLNRSLIDFISPWYNDVLQEMCFCGSINMDDLEIFIRTRPDISYVTKLSMVVLHYSDTNYTLSDSVAAPIDKKIVYASNPWSVLIPMKNHMIDVIDTNEYINPNHAAIENLRIGNEFVLVEKETASTKKITKGNDDSGQYITLTIDF